MSVSVFFLFVSNQEHEIMFSLISVMQVFYSLFYVFPVCRCVQMMLGGVGGWNLSFFTADMRRRTVTSQVVDRPKWIY